MEVEENTVGVSEKTPQSEVSDISVEEVSQNPNGSMEATLNALANLGGGIELSQEINASIDSGAQEGRVKEPAIEDGQVIKPDLDNNKKIADDILKQSITDKEKKEEQDGVVDNDGNKKEEIEKTVITSPIFGGEKTINSKQEKSDPIAYDGADVANKFIKEKTGYEDLESLISGSLNLQEKASGYDDAVKESKGYSDLFKNMPAELYEAVDSYANGKDWKTELSSRPNLDFAKNTDDHSSKSLVDNYMPGKFSNEEWEEYKGDDCDVNLKRAMDMAVSSSTDNYDSDRKGIESLRDKRIQDYDAKQKIMSNSVDNSIEFLKKNIEGIDSNYVDKLQKDLSIDLLTEMFLNSDGSFKEDAALKVVMANDGYKMIEQYRGIAERKTETKERQEVLLRTPDKVKAKKTGSEVNSPVNKNVQQQLDMLSRGFEKQGVY